MKHWIVTGTLFLFAAISVSSSVLAQEEAQIKQFNQQFTTFKQRLEKDEAVSQSLADQAKAVYLLGQKVYGADDLNIAALGEYYVYTMDAGFNQDDYVDVSENIVRIYTLNNKDTKGISDALLKLGNYYLDKGQDNKGYKTFNRLEDIVADSGDAALLASVRLSMAKLLYAKSMYNVKSVKKSRQFAEKAAEYYLGKDATNYADASFWLGKTYYSQRKNKQAIKWFSASADAYGALGDQAKAERVARTFLIKALMKDGQEALATNQCQTVGMLSKWEENGDITPLYIEPPSYPRNAAINRKEGWVRMSFVVDIEGYAKDIQVIDSDGGSAFERASTKVMKNWRFAPKYVNTEPVEEKATYTMEFKMDE